LLQRRSFSFGKSLSIVEGGNLSRPRQPSDKAVPGISWDFGAIPILPEHWANNHQARPSLAAPPLQPRLVIGEVDDPLEQEADQVADQVMRMSVPEVPLATAPWVRNPSVTGDGKAEGSVLQKMSAGSSRAPAVAAPGTMQQMLGSPGRVLDPSLRDYFEPPFGTDFSGVRVHTDDRAKHSAALIGARAYANGNHIFYGTGERPGADRLTAHELAHVTQQTLSMQSPVFRRAPNDQFSIASDVWVVTETLPDGTSIARPIVVVNTGKELKAFHKRSGESPRPEGHAGPQAGDWAPFDGFEVGERMVKDGYHGRSPLRLKPTDPLHGFGSTLNQRVSRWLSTQELPAGVDRSPEQVQGELSRLKVVDYAGRPIPPSPRGRGGSSGGGGAPPTTEGSGPPPPSSGQKPTPGKTTSSATGTTEGPTAETDNRPPTRSGDTSTSPSMPRFSSRVIEMGANFTIDLIVGLISDYIAMKIGEHFDRKDFERLLRELQPTIENRKREVYDSSPAQLRSIINKRQCYWIIQLRFGVHTTVWVGGGRAGTVHSNSVNLINLEISDSPTGMTEGHAEHGRPVVAPAQHAVVLLEDSRVVTYSEPIVSWHAEIEGLEGRLPPFGGPSQRPEAGADVLRFSANNRPVTIESLVAWARQNYPQGLFDPALLKNIYSSNEFTGSDDARERAAIALTLRLREENHQPSRVR
jgi:Domain of unknown function (DUF4157)